MLQASHNVVRINSRDAIQLAHPCGMRCGYWRTTFYWTILMSVSLLIMTTGPAFSGGLRSDKGVHATDRMRDLTVEPPSFGPPQRGHIYGGPYPPPYPYSYPYPYPPYPYPAYPWSPPPSYYAPPSGGPYDQQVIPAGRVALLVDPVSAEVFVDGHPLTQRSDLSYEVGLLVGKHTVLVRKQGYVPYEETLEISAGQRLMLTIRLNKQD